MSQTESYSDNRLLYLILEAQEAMLTALGGAPASSRLVAVTPTGGAAGTGDATKTFTGECLELTVSNDADTPLTFTVGGFALTLGPREVFDREPVQAFTSVTIDAAPGAAWRVFAFRLS